MAQNQKNRGNARPAYTSQAMSVRLIGGLLLIALGVLIALAAWLNMAGEVFNMLRLISRGLFGAGAYALPIPLVWGGITLMLSVTRKFSRRPMVLLCIMLALLCTTLHLVSFQSDNTPLMNAFQKRLAQMGVADAMPAYLTRAFDYGARYNAGGGLISMPLAWVLWKLFGSIFGGVIAIFGAVADFLFLIRLDVKGLLRKSQDRRTQRQAEKDAERDKALQDELAWQQEQARQQEAARQAYMRQQLQQQQPPHPTQQEIYQQAYQQAMQHYSQQPPVQNPYGQQGPIVSQVQPRGRKGQSAPSRGFQPTPEELGQAGIPPVQETARKKRGGIFSREKSSEEEPSLSRRKGQSEPPSAEDAPLSDRPPRSTGRNRPAPVFPSEQEPPRRRPIFQREETPEEPDVLYREEEPVFTPEEPAVQPPPPVRPARAARTAPQTARPTGQTGRTPAVHPPLPEEADTSFAAEIQQKPASENSFLSRLRAMKRAEGIEVPEEPAAQDNWADTPPWEESAAPAAPAAPLAPVVTAKKPEGSYQPDLKLKARRSGRNVTPAPMPDEPVSMPYVYPSMDLLSTPVGLAPNNEEEDAIRTIRLENTLKSFSVPAKVRNITHGPVISRFEMELAGGINVSKVTNLSRNLAMSLEVDSVRIEAPIPGKSLIGVEVPNKARAIVSLREVLEADVMRKAKGILTVALGKDISGQAIVCDLAKMPHLLIAGTTGSGKSKCINAILCSLLYRCSPKEVQLILIDPKRVELKSYNNLPHLIIPVVTDTRRAPTALAWAVGEMMSRYTRFQEMPGNVTSIDDYNRAVKSEDEKMSRIVIVIDELADLMFTCKRDVEDYIVRLAQLARAAGIHLIVATQRPSKDVITGLIKTNIPSRIAFKVSSNLDSRIILDRPGAEQLLGQGDMLYHYANDSAPIRVQGCLLSSEEVDRITNTIRETCPADYDPDIIAELERLYAESQPDDAPSDLPSPDDAISDDGSLLAQCIEMAVRDGQVSTSLIQRRLRLGYARAGRLVDEMEKRGIVGPKDGAKPRNCLISYEEFEAMRAAGELD